MEVDGFRGMAALHARKYTYEQSPGTHISIYLYESWKQQQRGDK